MRKGLFTLLSLVCAGLIWAAPAPANAADKIVIRFAHSNTPSDMDPYHALVTKMSDKLVKKLGADRIEIQEFPAGQIGSEERSFQDVQQGILQMTVLAVNNASIFSPPSARSTFPTSSRASRNSTTASIRTGISSTSAWKPKAAPSPSRGIRRASASSPTASSPSARWPNSPRSRSVPPTTRS